MKKILSLILCLTLVFSCAPAFSITAFAEEDYITVIDKKVYAGQYVDNSGAIHARAPGENYVYYAGNGEITLKNAVFSFGDSLVFKVQDKNLYITLIGENKVINDGGHPFLEIQNGVLNVSGEGSLSGIGIMGSSGFVLSGGTINFRDGLSSGNIIVSGGTLNLGGALESSGDMTVSGGNINITGASGSGMQATNGGNISITGGKVTTSASMYGLRSVGGAVSVTGGEVELTATGSLGPEKAIYGSPVTIGENMEIVAGSPDEKYVKIAPKAEPEPQEDYIKVLDQRVNAGQYVNSDGNIVNGKLEDNYIYYEGDGKITLKNATLPYSNREAIFSDGKDIDITLIGENEFTMDNSVRCLDIGSGELRISGEGSLNCNKGIIGGGVVISGGTLNLGGALDSVGDMTVSGGNINVTVTNTSGLKAMVENGIAGNIYITGGKVTASGGAYGLNSVGGEVSITGGEVEITETEKAIFGSPITIGENMEIVAGSPDEKYVKIAPKQEEMNSYSCAVLYEDGTLKITNNDFSGIPWENERLLIKKVIFDSSTNITAIPANAFSGCQNLEEITIPASVTAIGNRAFNGCKALTSITIPDSVETIGNYAFSECKALTSITIPNSVTSIGELAFNGCENLSSVVFEANSNLESIGNRAFIECKALTSITIPNSVTSIGDWAFFGCEKLSSVVFEANSNLESIGNSAFIECKALTSITIPNSVTSIGERAFTSCEKLSSVVFEENINLESIGNYVFDRCKVLTSITIPNSVTSIGEGAFSDCENLSSVDFEANSKLESIGNRAFNGCKALTSITIPDSVKTISSFAFGECKALTSITIPNSVTSIGDWAFNDCENLSSVVFEANSKLEYIGNSAFNGCEALASITIPNSVNTIGEAAFSGCTALRSVTIPDSVETIGDYAFNRCKALTSITIPDSVETIGSRAFNECEALTSVTIPDSINTIREATFNGCTALRSVTIPDSVTKIDLLAFNGCKALTSITIPNSVTSIGEGAFFGCEKLSSVVFEENSSLTSIGYQAFSGCTALTSITIPDYLLSIGELAFNQCTALTSVTIPASVTTIGGFAFNRCGALTEINYLGSIEEWDLIVIESYAIPNGVKINHTGSCVDNNNNHFCDLCIKELTHDFGTAWETDENGHWHECSCGAIKDKENHSGGIATCTKKAVCKVCAMEYGEVLPHDYSEDWETDENGHWHECSCGAIKDKENHSGGIATCTEKAVCEVCAMEYGEVDPDNHADYGKVTKKAVKETCTKDGYTGDIHCKGCDDLLERGTVTLAHGHDYGRWITTEEATENEGGKQVKICHICGNKTIRYTKPLSEDGIEIIYYYDKDEETNPNTGAPVFVPAIVGFIFAAAAIGKRR